MKACCTIGGVGGALFGGFDCLDHFTVPLMQISLNHIVNIAFTAAIGVVVTFFLRKLLEYLWDKWKRKK